MTPPTVTLGEIFDTVIGRTPSRLVPSYWGGGLPWASISDLNGALVKTTAETLSSEGVQASGAPLIPKGTLLFGFKLSIGKMAFAGVDLYTNEAIAALSPKDPAEVDPKYMYYALSTVADQLEGNFAAKGRTLNRQTLHGITLPFPKFPEQQRIAAILDEQLSLVRLMREKAQEQIQATHALQTALLQRLLTIDIDANSP